MLLGGGLLVLVAETGRAKVRQGAGSIGSGAEQFRRLDHPGLGSVLFDFG